MHPPQHSVTAQIVFFASRAFDLDRAVKEKDAMANGDDHPMAVYLSGRSRYDLDAPSPCGPDRMACARDYLKPDHGCREWRPRRLKAMEVASCRDRGGKVGQLNAFALAMGESRPLNDSQIEAMVDEYGMDEVCDVGEAALRASEAPKAAEKKL